MREIYKQIVYSLLECMGAATVIEDCGGGQYKPLELPSHI